MVASIKDVAKRAGVSISTVSNVINGTKYVSNDLTQKVKDAIDDLGYVVDAVARNMKTGYTKTIGVITADICGLFYPYVIKGIYEVVNKRGYNLTICDIQTISDNENALLKEKESFKKLISNRVDGIIFVSCISDKHAERYFNEIKRTISDERKIAFVSVERDFSHLGIDSVFYENEKAGHTAVTHLYDMGCRNIAHITGPLYYTVAQDRIKGYKRAVKELKMNNDIEKMVEHGDYTHQSGYWAIESLLEKNDKIDGVFAANDQMAIGVLKFLKEKQIKVPQEIKVIGCDDVFASRVVDPQLSTIHIRKRHMGVYAAETLLKRIDSMEKEEKESFVPAAEKLDTWLVVRTSTLAEAEDEWRVADW